MGKFENKVVIVTGSGQGLGLVIARRFLEEGAKVIGIGRTESKMKKSEELLNSTNYVALTYDVGNEESWVEIVEYVKANYGELDILVNNAGYLANKPISDMSFAEFKETMHCDVETVFLGMKYGFDILKKDGTGNIVNVASVAALRAGPQAGNDAGYQGGKAAVVQLTKHAAYVYAPSKVRVNVVCPAGINTKMRQDYLDAHPEMIPSLAVNSPLPPHCTEPEDVADAIFFLASQDAKMITGTSLVIDCGKMCT